MTLLTDEHVAKSFQLQLSGYYTDRKACPEGGFYYQSNLIPSTNWNHCLGLNPTNEEHFEFASQQARAREIPLAFFLREKELDLSSRVDAKHSINRERWMMCFPDTIAPAVEIAKSKFSLSNVASPSADYMAVLGNLFEEEAYNARFRNFYIPTLEKSKLHKDTSVRHAVLYVDGNPVSCGSVYISEQFAGLYNVGTKFGEGKNGYGAAISRYLTKTAFDEGAESVFLQCVIGTHVENLYESLGYKSVECPGIMVFE